MKEKIKNSFLFFLFGIFVSAFILFSNSQSFAELKAMTDKEMRSETAQAGLASFSQSDNTVRMFMDIHLETWTEIDSAKIGYYSRDSVPGWDQSWQNIKIGTQDIPLQMDGFVFKADFEDLQTSDKPTLKRLVIGTNRLVGTMQANIESFTGVYNPALTGESAPVDPYYTRANLGDKTFNFSSPTTEVDKSENQGFFIVITPEGNGTHSGIQVVAGYNELNISSSPFSQGEWWDK